MKKGFIAAAIAVIGILVYVFGFASSEPELIVDNSYKHRGTYSGNMYYNTYTFEIKNDSRIDIESVDYFNIYFYDSYGDEVGCWVADASDLRKLALDAKDTVRFQINVPEKDLPYSRGWSYDFEYEVTYYS